MVIVPVNSYHTPCTILVLNDRRSPVRVAVSKNWSMNSPLLLSASPNREMKPETLPSSNVSCTNSPSRKKEYIPEGSFAGAEAFAVCWAAGAADADTGHASAKVTTEAATAANTRHLRIMFAPVMIHHCTPLQDSGRAWRYLNSG